MTNSDFDMTQYLDLFMQESREQLETLETEILNLEKKTSQDHLQLIFRAAHNLKGSSRAMGFTHFSSITHEIENLLDKLRCKELVVTTEITDTLLSSVDSLNQLLKIIAKTGNDDFDSNEIVKKLQSFSSHRIDEKQTDLPLKPNHTEKILEGTQTLRVDISRLDHIMNLVEELVIDRTKISQIKQNLSQAFSGSDINNLSKTIDHLAIITGDLQDQIMRARMMPIDTIFNRFPRVVRDLANKLGKEVKLEVSGGDTELDRSVLEVIGDPLLHILRNSIDHGIETPDEREKKGKSREGTIQIHAKHQEKSIIIDIIDNGKGIDIKKIKSKAITKNLISQESAEKMSDNEALHLLFTSGFSTATEVSEVSGRGVGMDIVRSNIQKLGGVIDLNTELDIGTTFTLKIPLTLAIIRGLLVTVSQTTYVLPFEYIIEIIVIKKNQIQNICGKDIYVFREKPISLIWLNKVLYDNDKEHSFDKHDQCSVVIVNYLGNPIGLITEGIAGEQEVVIKPLGYFCGEVPGISGSTILGSGNIALIIDINHLVRDQKTSIDLKE